MESLEKSERFEYLNLIFAGKGVVIGATKGTETLASADDVFSYIDPGFKDEGFDENETSTEEVEVEVYEQIEDASYPDIFGSINQDLNRLCLKTPQIKSFIVNHANDYMRDSDEWTYFRFLFKAKEEFFVADARVNVNGERGLRLSPLLRDNVRHAIHRHRIIVPKLDDVASTAS